MRDVYVIGMGAVTAAGAGVEAADWAIRRGKVCRSPMPVSLTVEWQPSQTVKYGYLLPSPLRSRRMLLAASEMAVTEARRTIPDVRPDALFVGSTSDGLSEMEAWVGARDRTFERHGYIGSLAPGLGETCRIPSDRCWQFSEACASSSYAIAMAATSIAMGRSEVAVAGGADRLCASVVSMFDAARIYAEELKPFDVNRKGVVLGEAAAYLVLASSDAMYKIRQTPLARLSGWGLTQDATGKATPEIDGIARAIREACWQADTFAIDFVCAHGTGTPSNDKVETSAILTALPAVPVVSSYKGALGHPQGASGAVGAALTIRAMQLGSPFPTVGLTDLDPEIAVPIARLEPWAYASDRIANALVLSSGSWGANAALVFSEVERD